jgi:proton-dependent oligopeptide transporter, POT family
MKGNWSINPVTVFRTLGTDDFWNRNKPSRVANKPNWMTFDDAWVDELRRGLSACAGEYS